jgi:hypothetical protein
VSGVVKVRGLRRDRQPPADLLQVRRPASGASGRRTSEATTDDVIWASSNSFSTCCFSAVRTLD